MSHPPSASPSGNGDAGPSVAKPAKHPACDRCRDMKKGCEKGQGSVCARCLVSESECLYTYMGTGKVSRVEHDAVIAERDELAAEIDNLRGKAREYEEAFRTFAADRAALIADRHNLQRQLTEYERTFRVLAAERAALIADRDNLHCKVTEQEAASREFDNIKDMVLHQEHNIAELLSLLSGQAAASVNPQAGSDALGAHFIQLHIDQKAQGQGPRSLDVQVAEDRTERVAKSSADYVLQLLADAQCGGRPPGSPPKPGISINLPPQTASLSSLVPNRTKVGPNVSLPETKQAARLLFNDQFTYIGTIFAFADRARFEQLLDEVYSRRLDITDSASCLAHAKLLAIMAFGQLYSVNHGLGSVSPPGSEYFAAAVQLLPEIHGPPSVRFVETLCLVGYFMQNLTHRAAAFAYVGLAVRMAISLGMHEEVPEPDRAALSGEELEYRRRVWWSVYSMDRILTVKSGNPVMIHDEDISVAMPSRLPSEPEYCPAVTLAFYTELSRILGDIARLYAPRSSSSPQKLQEAMHDLAGRLQRWHDALPEQLQFDFERMHDTREGVSTLLHYYQCINMTVRPFVYTLVRRRLQGSAEDRARDWREGLPAATQEIVVWCIDAARKTIRMMKLANKTKLVANYGYMDTEHALSAAILLLMVCAAFPPDPANTASLSDALSLLASMGDRGNRHIAARSQVLRQLAADLVPNLVLPDSEPEADPGAAVVPPAVVPPGVVDGPPEEQPLERFWDQVVVGAEGFLGAFEPVVPIHNQGMWDCVYDDMMQDME